MLHPRAPIPIVTLVLSAACQPKDVGSTSTDTGATGSDTSGPSGATGGTSGTSDTGGASGTDTPTGSTTSEPPVFPAIQCDDMLCSPGKFCLFKYDYCTLVPEEPCDDNTTGDDDTTGDASTGTPDQEYCWALPDIYACKPIPQDCRSFTIESSEFAECIEYYYDGPCPTINEFEDGTLRCQRYFCQEGLYYGYCDYC